MQESVEKVTPYYLLPGREPGFICQQPCQLKSIPRHSPSHTQPFGRGPASSHPCPSSSRKPARRKLSRPHFCDGFSPITSSIAFSREPVGVHDRAARAVASLPPTYPAVSSTKNKGKGKRKPKKTTGPPSEPWSLTRPEAPTRWGRVVSHTNRLARAYAQRIVTTRLLYRLHDPASQFSRMQRIYPRPW